MRGSRPGKNVQLTENEIRGLCLKSREIFLSQPILLELEAPLKICGKLPIILLLCCYHMSVTIWAIVRDLGCLVSEELNLDVVSYYCAIFIMSGILFKMHFAVSKYFTGIDWNRNENNLLIHFFAFVL